MKIAEHLERILNTDAAQDLLHEIVAMELADAYENTKVENAISYGEQVDFRILKEAFRQAHNYYTPEDRHIP